MTRGHTLDFTLRHRQTGSVYVAELKCELAYENYRYLLLTHPDQLRHHAGSQAFAKFLRIAQDVSSLDVRCQGRLSTVDGAVLIWGSATMDGLEAVRGFDGFADVLTLEQMASDLQAWEPEVWCALVARYQGWTAEWFQFQIGPCRQVSGPTCLATMPANTAAPVHQSPAE